MTLFFSLFFLTACCNSAKDCLESAAKKNEQKNWTGAIEDANKAMEFDPSLGDPYLYRGVAKCEMGERQQCVEDLRTAKKIYQERNRTDRITLTQKILDKLQEPPQSQSNPSPERTSSPSPSPTRTIDPDNDCIGEDTVADINNNFIIRVQVSGANSWSAWKNFSYCKKNLVGREACRVVESDLDLNGQVSYFFSKYGGNSRSFSDLEGVSIVIAEGVGYYCPKFTPRLIDKIRANEMRR